VKFSNPQVQTLVEELVRAGLLDRKDAVELEYTERIMGEKLTTQTVVDRVNAGKLRMDQYEMLSSLAEDHNAEPPEYKPAVSTQIGSWFSKQLGEFNEKGDVFGPGTGSGVELGEDIGTELKEMAESGARSRQLKNDFVRIAKDTGYDLDYADLMGAGTLEEMAEAAGRKAGMPPDVAVAIGREVMTVQQTRELEEQDIEEALAEDEEYTRLASENPEYVKNYRGFIKMDRAVPGKYKFDPETGAIYDLAAGAYVDSKGATLTTEEQIRSEYGLTDLDPLPGLQEQAFEEQWQPPWLAMGIDEDSYVSIMDVVRNKSGYGADPVRYAPGMESFLGGFASDYVVSRQDFSVREQAMLDFNMGGGAGEREAIFNPEYWNDLSNRVVQETRRPWYDQNDNWNLFVGLSPESVATVQRTLIDWGALDADEVVLGVWGPTEAQQMNQVMTVANARGVQWTDASIAQLMPNVFKDQTKAATPRAAFTPEPYRPMDPATVERTVTDSIRQMIGRDPTEEDLAELGAFLRDNHGSAYAADVAAAKQQYSAQGAALESGAQFGDPGVGPAEVDWESRYINQMEERFAPQLASQERGEKAAQQQDMGVAMSNLMSQLGGGVG